MPDSFACPHCDKRYPSLATLVNRKVRCQACRKPFRLRPDGTVEKLEGTKTVRVNKEQAEQAVGAPREEATGAEDRIREMTRSWSQNATGSLAGRRARRTHSSEDIPDEAPVTNRLEALRKAAGSNLKDAAARAAATVNPTTTERAARASVASSSLGDPLDRQVIARLSGRGSLRNHRRLRPATGLLAAGIVAIVLFAWALLGDTDPRRAAIVAYAADRQQPNEQAWLETVDGRMPLLRLARPGEVHLEPARPLDLAPLQTVVEEALAGMIPHDGLAVFVEAEHERDFLDLLDVTSLPRDAALARLRADGIEMIPYEEFHETLRQVDSGPDEVVVMSLLMAGEGGPEPGRHWRELLIAGQPPDYCEIAYVGGQDARAIRFEGNVPRSLPLPAWGGILMRCSGGAWESGWRMLTCFDRSDEQQTQDPLLRRVAAARQRAEARRINAPVAAEE